MKRNRLSLINELLEEPFWPETLNTGTPYMTTHDDNDGDPSSGWLSVTFSVDGDAWIQTHGRGIRYRVPDVGGGQFGKVRNALLILAEAIRQEGVDPYPKKNPPTV